MDLLHRIVELLGRLGFNTTRLKWKLFQLERRRSQPGYGMRLPTSLQWWSYPHKRCRQCRGLLDRDARTCPHCGRRAPTMLGYRISRLLGVMMPSGAPVMLYAFMAVMIAHFGLMLVMQGMSAATSISYLTGTVFGAWSPLRAIVMGEYWRYLSFGLGHGHAMHILFNLFALTQVGPIIEERIGPWRMLVVITVTQLAAAVASHIYYFSLLNNVLVPTIGASGWLFGLIGFGIAHFSGRTGVAKELQGNLVRWALYSLIFGFVIGANNAAHIGGMLAGLGLGWIPEPRRHVATAVNRVWKGIAVVCAVLWIVTFAYLTHSIITGWTFGGQMRSDEQHLPDVSVLDDSR